MTANVKKHIVLLIDDDQYVLHALLARLAAAALPALYGHLGRGSDAGAQGPPGRRPGQRRADARHARQRPVDLGGRALSGYRPHRADRPCHGRNGHSRHQRGPRLPVLHQALQPVRLGRGYPEGACSTKICWRRTAAWPMPTGDTWNNPNGCTPPWRPWSGPSRTKFRTRCGQSRHPAGRWKIGTATSWTTRPRN